MASNPLANYLGRVKNHSEKENAARRQHIEQWQKAVEKLYAIVERLVGTQAKLSVKPTQIREPDIGIYEIKVLTIDVGPLQLSLTPKFSIVKGAHGRVDIKGPRGIVRITRMIEKRKDHWLLSLKPDLPAEKVSLNANTLATAVRIAVEGSHAVAADAAAQSEK